MGLREEKKQRQREAIIEAAGEMFRRQGFDGTRVADLAKALSVSEPTVFNYFPTKQALADAVVSQSLENLLGVFAHQDPDNSVIGSLWAVVEASLEFYLSADRLGPSIVPGFATGYESATFALLADLMLKGQRTGEIRKDLSAGRLAEIFMSSMLGALNKEVSRETVEGDRRKVAEFRKRIHDAWSVLEQGLRSAAST